MVVVICIHRNEIEDNKMNLNYAKQSDVTVGNTLYAALILINGNGEFYNHIEKVVITTEPQPKGKNNDLFAVCTITEINSDYHKENDLFSLEDHGIIPNSYNLHKTFTDLESAEKYVEVFMNNDIMNMESILSSGVVSREKLQHKVSNHINNI